MDAQQQRELAKRKAQLQATARDLERLYAENPLLRRQKEIRVATIREAKRRGHARAQVALNARYWRKARGRLRLVFMPRATGRERRHGCNQRQRGSRRTARARSPGSSDDPHESDPDHVGNPRPAGRRGR